MAGKQSPTHPLWAELRMVNAGNGDTPAKVAIVGPEGMAYQFEFRNRHAAQTFRDELLAAAEQSKYLLEQEVERTPQGHRLGICDGGGKTRGRAEPIGI
jgi:hypothetical protein